MKPLPDIEDTLLLRTDFSDDTAWTSLCDAVQKPNEDGFRAYVACVNDPAYDGLTVEQLIALKPKGCECGEHTFALVADRTTFSNSDRPVLVVDLYDEPGRSFRVIPRELCGVENNLSLANMDFADFADNVSSDGVFRGFEDP